AVITPTTFYVKTPSVEVSNRIIRDNFFAVGNFLRVKFEDEDTFGGLSPIAYYDNQHEVWARIERCFRHGIDIAGRHYDWLACGNSQFRERGAYFFTPYSEEKTARNIRTALGDFSSINIVAKCMARIGQCFSTTRASTNIGTVEQRSIKDIERNGYCFTDGVGKVSPFVAQMVANQSGVWNYAAQASNPSLLEAYLNSLPYDGNVQKPAFATWVSVCISKHQVIKRINTSADIGDSHICFLIG
ncbi:MAG: hypothetical protein EOP48_10690, partial [Sphingobacteriales bacterium]